MLKPKQRKWFYTGLILLGVGIAFLILSQYANYCDSPGRDQQYRCASYEIATSIFALLEQHNALITAIATVLIGYFTYTLYTTSAEQSLLTRESIEFARQEFVATHRPKIIVYGMEVSLPGDDKPRHVHFRYVNAGDTDASVTSIESHIHYSKGMVVRAGLELRRHDVIKQPILVRSGANGVAITPDGAGFINLVRSGKEGVVFCVGVIVYRDSNSIERRTGFCRWFDGKSERWKKLEDDDYEYSY
jgi:hypothetical protein